MVGQLLGSLLGESDSLGAVGLQGSSVGIGGLGSLHLAGSRGSMDLAADLVGLLAMVSLLLGMTVLGPGLLDGVDTLNLGLAETLLHPAHVLDTLLEWAGLGCSTIGATGYAH